ncbi:RNA polymerase II-associated [Hyaloraphidium curvatum]|nr:RNA polymerase II-associated [Hyaloraphidium curvatum]
MSASAPRRPPPGPPHSSSRPPTSSSRPAKPAAKPPAKKPGYDFAYALSFTNALPPPPFAPKLLAAPIAPDAAFRYDARAVAALQTTDVLPTDAELGMPVDMIEMGVFDRELAEKGKGLDSGNPVPEAELHEADRALLWHPDEGMALPKAVTGLSGKRNDVFLRATQYISNESRVFGTTKTSVESQMGLSVANEAFSRPLDRTPAGQLSAIRRTFDRVQQKTARLEELRHERKPHVTAVEAIPVFPDFENWTNNYIHTVFHDDPTGREIRVGADAKDAAIPDEEDPEVLRVQEAIYYLESDFACMYLPTEESFSKLLQKRKFDFELEDEEYDYSHVRNYGFEYSKDVRNRRFALAIRGEKGGAAALYSMIHATMRFKKRRAKGHDKAKDEPQQQEPAQIIKLRSRDWTEEEIEEKRHQLEQICSPEDAEIIIRDVYLPEQRAAGD